ncbi:MAG: mechanosensitive ion channel [Legionella sp.]|nr:mechanosensitive ion channel [Legionella sp.]
MAHGGKAQDQADNFLQYLSQEKNHLVLSLNEIQNQSQPIDDADFIKKRQMIDSMFMLNQAKITSLNAFLDNQNKQLLYYTQKIKLIQQMPIINSENTIQSRIAAYTKLLEKSKTSIEMINDNLSTAKGFQDILTQQKNRLEQWNVYFQLEKKIKDIKNYKDSLHKQLESLYQKNPKELKTKQTVNSMSDEASLLINNQEIGFVQNQINALNIQKKIIKAQISLLKNSDLVTLQQVITTYTEAINQYDKIVRSLQDTATVLKSEDAINVSPSFRQSVAALKKKINDQLQIYNAAIHTWRNQLAQYQSQHKKITSTRQSLAEYKINTWPQIINKLVAIPGLFYKTAKSLVLRVYDSYYWLDKVHTILLTTSLVLILLFFLILNQFLKSLSYNQERSRLTGYLYDGILILIQKNIPSFCLLSMLLAIFYYTNIAYVHYALFFNLFMIWLIFRGLILIARLTLLERVSDYSGEDVKLYYRIKWMLLFGGWTAALMTFSHMLPLSLLLQDIFNRLFMLFILTISLVAWKSKSLILDLFKPVLSLKKRYIKNAVSILVMLIPVTLLTTALIGLSGFYDLAWTMSRYQAYILVIIVGYILARGLLFDALEFLSETMISSLHNGWLWIEVFLKPLDKILRLALIISSIFLLFDLFGWLNNSLVMLNLKRISQYPIIYITGIHITVESLIEFLFLVALLIWAAKWTREFSYRWLYVNTDDPGIRNSFSVFTQYAVILLGCYVTLRVLGLDFSGMSMILGGLAVGMGFGLKDFANNIVGGIMLLIERPVREGDLISIGTFEGMVAHIGIRSMRVSTWDNTEVLVPNAETFNKSFINWTHQNGIIRTIVPIKVSREDDPIKVQQLILDVLAIIPEIVADPPVEVYLKKIDEALIEFEVRYFIDVHQTTRFAVQSKVLFAITAQFKAAGVRHPVAPIAVEFKEGHGDFFTPSNRTKD